MPGLTCEICERRECDEPWKVCRACRAIQAECRKEEEKTRRQLRAENLKLFGSTTPGMKRFSGSVHERRGRKLIRPLKQDVFLEEQEDESERDS